MESNRLMLDASHSRPDSYPYECRLAARRLLSGYGWSCVSEDELSQRIVQQRHNEAEQKPLQLLAHMCAASLLYSMCCATHDPDKVDQGYADLFHYLERIAIRRWPEHVPDIVQQALELIYKQFDRCQSPESFLAFARFKLLQAAKDEYGHRPSAVSLDSEITPVQLATPSDVITAVFDRTEFEALLQAIQRLPDFRQRVVVYRKYFRRDSDKAIARDLGITTSHVAVLRLRARQQLRNDKQLRAIFLPEDPI